MLQLVSAIVECIMELQAKSTGRFRGGHSWHMPPVLGSRAVYCSEEQIWEQIEGTKRTHIFATSCLSLAVNMSALCRPLAVFKGGHFVVGKADSGKEGGGKRGMKLGDWSEDRGGMEWIGDLCPFFLTSWIYLKCVTLLRALIVMSVS